MWSWIKKILKKEEEYSSEWLMEVIKNRYVANYWHNKKALAAAVVYRGEDEVAEAKKALENDVRGIKYCLDRL